MCRELFFSVFFLCVIYHLNEDFSTVTTQIVDGIFTQKVVNFHPIENGFFVGFCLCTPAISTGKSSRYFYWHAVDVILMYRRLITLLNPYFAKTTVFPLNCTTPQTDYLYSYFNKSQSVIDHKVLFSYSFSNMWVVTAPTIDIFCDRYTHKGSASSVSSVIFCQVLDLPLSFDQYIFTPWQSQLETSSDSVRYSCKTPKDRLTVC